MNGISRKIDAILLALVVLCIARFWLMPLPSSFWVDESVTAFVVQHGSQDPSLAVAPQVTKSIYYAIPRAAETLFGYSEIVYRIPSVLMMGAALFLIAKLAARLIHPEAAWFAVFACLSLRGFNYQAADARPYALGTLVAAGAFLSLARWLDSPRATAKQGWSYALLFVLCGALLWRVHLVFWPMYLAFALYAIVRLVKRETEIPWTQALAVFAVVGVTLIPVLLEALSLLREAQAHVIVDPPTLSGLKDSLKFGLLAVGCAVLILASWRHWKSGDPMPSWGSVSLILGWWLIHPLAIYGYSRITGNSLFVPRYLSIALPGSALMATLLPVRLIPREKWKPLAVAFGLGVLLTMGQWKKLWPEHHNSDWRRAAQTINRLSASPQTPVVLPSPFIEARWPVWRPDYPLPGFLYSYLPSYPISAKPYLLPFQPSAEGLEYASELARGPLAGANQFFVYGGDINVRRWTNFFAGQPGLDHWTHRALGPFGDVEVVLFERP